MKKKRFCHFFLVGILIVSSGPALAEQTPDNILNAIVKIKANIPGDAATARILGTEREGNGVIIDK
ncbi:MAG: hypothetical protein PVF29_05200, partial [Desulfobacterales bacterium]